MRPAFEKYRYYDEATRERLKQILVLRKMQIPIKDIIRIYESEDMSLVVEAFVERIRTIEEEVNALNELKTAVNQFLQTMLEHGIRKISALPLLYEEMNKHLHLDEAKPMGWSYQQLAELADRTAKPADIRLVVLPAILAVSSYRKGTDRRSDPDALWRWIQEVGLPLGSPGDHGVFEFQSPRHPGETVLIVKLPEDANDTGDFEEYRLESGLFAAVGVYADEDIRARFNQLVQAFDTNPYYEIDYLHGGRLRHETLIETVLSPDEQRERLELLVPVKKRIKDSSIFPRSERLEAVSAAELERSNPILFSREIDLREITPILDPVYRINERGEAEFQTWIDKRVLSTNDEVPIPFRVDVTFKTAEASLRLYHGKAAVMVNLGNIFDLGDTQDSLLVRDPVFGTERIDLHQGKIQPNEYNRLTWIVGETHFAVLVNGEVRHCGIQYPYMKLDLGQLPAHPIIIGSNSAEVVTLRSIRVSRILVTKKPKVKGGELTLTQKPSNNVLPNLHPLVTYHYGQNYLFNGCMAYLMECLGENKDQLNYDFFAGISGDHFTQVYGRYYPMHCNCVSVVVPKRPFFDKIFGLCGYAYTYVTSGEIRRNRERYLRLVMAEIDWGVPVLSKQAFDHGFDDGNYRIICGYEDNGRTLLYLEEDHTEPVKWNAEDGGDEDWIWAGPKQRAICLEEVYRKSIEAIPELLTMPEVNRCTFGPQAFRDWAADIERGRYDGLTSEEFNAWRDYTIYVCNLATNSGGCQGFLEKAQTLLPDLTFLSGVRDCYSRTGELWNELETLGGGFNIVLEVLQDPVRRKKIAEKLREFAVCMEDVLKRFGREVPSA